MRSKITVVKKINVLVWIVASLLSISCEIDAIEQDIVRNATVGKSVKKENLPYKYNYKNKFFNEEQWADKIKSSGNSDFSIIGINENLFVFDTKQEAQIFDEGVVQQKIKDKSIGVKSLQKVANDDILMGSAVIIYSIKVWDKINYDSSGNYHTFYRIHTVERWKPNNLWGDFYLTDADFETDLPISVRKKVSSCKLNLIVGGSVLTSNGGPVYLMCKIYLNAGTLADDSRLSFVTTLYKGNNIGSSTRDISDFREYRMWSLLGIGTWNDNIQSIQVKIR